MKIHIQQGITGQSSCWKSPVKLSFASSASPVSSQIPPEWWRFEYIESSQGDPLRNANDSTWKTALIA